MVNAENISNYNLFSNTTDYYENLFTDILNAKTYIYIELYRLCSDTIGNKLINLLSSKCKEGVDVLIMLDSWGTKIPKSFFKQFISDGGQVRFFAKIRFFIDFFTKNHKRNHRKLTIIDDIISYIGSANITDYNVNWRETILRIESPIAIKFKNSFLKSFYLYNEYIFKKNTYRKSVYYNDFEIIQELPSIYHQRIKKKYEKMISDAKNEIFIETPYLLPGFKLRHLLSNASKRGVNVNIITPYYSDMKTVDYLRNKYLGFYHSNNIKLYLYNKGNLHSKCILIDDTSFSIGSANFDYRSFRYQHEIALFGSEKQVIKLLKNHITETLAYCKPFDYNEWKNRPLYAKILGWLLLPFRHLF